METITEKPKEKSHFLASLEAMEAGINEIKEDYRLLRNIPAGGLQQLANLRRFEASSYDNYAELGEELFSKLVPEYRNTAAEFNNLLDERIEYARKFVIKQNSDEQRKREAALEQRIIEAEKRAGATEEHAKELRLALYAEQQKNTVLEYNIGAEKNAHERISGQINEVNTHLTQNHEALKSRLDSSESGLRKTIHHLAEELTEYERNQANSSKDIGRTVANGFSELNSRLGNYVEAQNGEKGGYRKYVEKQVAELGAKVDELLIMKKEEAKKKEETRIKKLKEAIIEGCIPKKAEEKDGSGYGSWYTSPASFNISTGLRELGTPTNVYLIGLSAALSKEGVDFVKRLELLGNELKNIYSCGVFARSQEDMVYLEGLKNCLDKWVNTSYLLFKFEDPVKKEVSDKAINLLEKYISDSKKRLKAA